MRVPASTYRVQFHSGFRFDDARRIVPYLHALGITDVYASPILAARPGSTHGYDVVDPTRLNPELGSRRDFDRLVRALRRHDMGLVVDVVPNHMAMSSDNRWWMDVLRNGRASAYAGFFDIDWEAPALDGKVLVPILGAPYAEVLDRGELWLTLEEDGLTVRYFEHRVPIDPKTWGRVLGDGLDELGARLGTPHAAVRGLRSLLRSIERLPPRTDPRAAEVARRRRGVRSIERRLVRLCASVPEARAHVEAQLRRWGGRSAAAVPDGQMRYDLLDTLIGDQAWLLANWRAAPTEIDYRRFFDIADLVALCSQEREVFEATHALMVRLVREGAVTGLRVDHVDGLWDPQEYLERLRDATGGAYVVVEKVLARDETIPPAWPVAGTTGYEFLNAANDLFVDGPGWERLRDRWAGETGAESTAQEIAVDGKRQVMEQLFASEVEALSARLQRLARRDRYGRDLTRAELSAAFVEVTASLPVYRTYARDLGVSPRDRALIEGAVRDAGRRTGPELSPALEFLRRVLLLERAARRGALARDRLAFVMRWQQFTGAVMAKGFEDTTLYVWTPLLARNDVGSEPGARPLGVEEFHRWSSARARRGARGLLATSTHDTKRSEDARARIDALSEMPEEFLARFTTWRCLHAGRRRPVPGGEAPDANEEWFLYQTLVGVWPLEPSGERETAGRVRDYLRKALREAKIHSNWIEPDERYERAVDAFARAVLARGNTLFRSDLRALVRRVALVGALNGLSQAVLKIGSPGVPDLYQGTEAWNLRLVDPDNREPVDFDAAARELRDLDRLDGRGAGDLLAAWEDGRVKRWVTSRALRCRRANPQLFGEGSYLGLVATGPRAEQVVAFARRLEGAWAVVVAGRRLGPVATEVGAVVGAAWSGTAIELPSSAPVTWADALTGRVLDGEGTLDVATVLGSLPVAFLVGGEGGVP